MEKIMIHSLNELLISKSLYNIFSYLKNELEC